jgi:hypothetical protein
LYYLLLQNQLSSVVANQVAAEKLRGKKRLSAGGEAAGAKTCFFRVITHLSHTPRRKKRCNLPRLCN